MVSVAPERFGVFSDSRRMESYGRREGGRADAAAISLVRRFHAPASKIVSDLFSARRDHLPSRASPFRALHRPGDIPP
jgi:hypothetical protein